MIKRANMPMKTLALCVLIAGLVFAFTILSTPFRLEKTTVVTEHIDLHVHRVGEISSRQPPTTLQPVEVPVRSRRGDRLVTAFSYWEKTTMAICSMFSLLRFATEWNAEVPLPFFNGSFSYGLVFPIHQQHINPSFYPLSVLFNESELQNQLFQHRLTKLIDYHQFIKRLACTENIFLIATMYRYKKVYKSPHIVQASCNSRVYRHSKYIKDSFPSKKVTCCEVYALTPMLPDDIARGCGFKNLDNFTVIFEEWRGITRPGPKRKFRLFVPPNFMHFSKPSAALMHSRYVIGNATAFISQTVGDSEFIAVHIRTEKLHRRKERKIVNDTQCILDTITLATEVSRNHSDIKHMLYFTDYYGDRYYADIFKSHNITLTQFHPQLYHSITSGGAFIGQVEQEFMSRAAVLVISGGGSFQQQIVTRYKFNGRNSSHTVYSVNKCM